MPANYNNYFPVGYQPMTYQQPTSNTNTGIVWVQGEAGAKAYPVASGQSMLLMDSESESFFIKSTDVSGMPLPLRVFSYKEIIGNEKKEVDMTNYVTRQELEEKLASLNKQKSIRRERIDG